MWESKSQHSAEDLRRWERHGGHWRVVDLTRTEATLQLLTCLGEPTEQVRSSDPALLAYVIGRNSSALRDPAVTDRRAEPADGEMTGMASFPASDPPACWTWEPDRLHPLGGP